MELPDGGIDEPFFQNGNNISNSLKRISLRNLKINSEFQMDPYESNEDIGIHNFVGIELKYDIEAIEQLLQMLVPLSPKNYELQQQIKTELEDETTEIRSLNALKTFEDKMKKEIDDKYNKFDENESSMIMIISTKNGQLI